MNWVALGITIVVSFFLSPYAIHKLGNVGYGVWTLVNSLISYMELLDLGLRGAITRFVSRDHAAGKHEEAGRAVSAALWFRLAIGLTIVLVSLVLSRLAVPVFHIPSTLAKSASWAIITMGAALALTLTGGLFGGILAGLHRFDYLSGSTIGQTLLRAAGFVFLLESGHGIVALAIWELFCVAAGTVVRIALCFYEYSELRISLRLPDGAIVRSLWTYSFYAFVINFSIQLVYYTDNLVVGRFVSAEAVTFYAIGGGLMAYLRQLVASLTQTFTPLASSLDARGRPDHVRQLLIQGTRAAMLLALPVEVGLLFRGPSFIGLWVGQQYVEIAGTVLRILLVSEVFAIANYTSAGIAYGLSKHRPVAMWAIGEGLGNLAVSTVLVRYMGILGVAWGTVIPGLIIHVLIWPRYASKIAGIPILSYLWQAWFRPLFAAVPFAIGCYIAGRTWRVQSLPQFFVQIAALLPIYLLTVALCFRKDTMDLARRLGWFRSSLSESPASKSATNGADENVSSQAAATASAGAGSKDI